MPRKILANNNYDIQLIELYPCNSKDELHSREGYWQKEIKCLNRCIAGRTKKQYNLDNKAKIAEQKQVYNKVRHMCECGKEYTIDHRSRHIKSQHHQTIIAKQ